MTSIRRSTSDNHGVLYLNSRIRFEEISDGSAFTILLGEKPGGGLDLGWVSGTRSTLRSTGYPLERSAGFASTTSPADRNDLFAEIVVQANDGIMAGRRVRRILELPFRRVQLSFLRWLGATSEDYDRPANLPAAGQPRRW